MKNYIGAIFVGMATVFVMVGGCSLTSTVVGITSPTPQPSGVTNPIIQTLAPNPTAVAHKSDVMTFTVGAYAANGAPLSYTWTSTKGYLSSTTGQAISWTPQKTDGTLESGLATIQVIVSDGKGGTAQGAVNIMIAADGSAAKQ